MIPNHSYTWLLFDADGTLFDYERAESTALQGAFADFALSLDASAEDAYRAINRQVWVDFENGRITAEALRVVRFERLFSELRLQLDAGAFSACYLRHLSQATFLIPGAERMVRALKERYHLAVITNGLKDVQRPRLACSAISDCFEELAISEELGVAKPDARFFDLVFARIGNPSRDAVLVIGDSLTSDIQGGAGYGLDTCWFNPGGKPASGQFSITYQIERLDELEGLLA